MLTGSAMAGPAAALDVRAAMQAAGTRPQPSMFQSVTAAGPDVAEISELARNGIASVDPMSIFGMVRNPDGSGGYKSLDQVESEFAADFAGFQDVLGKFFRKIGLNPEQAITMQPNGRGSIDVTGENAGVPQVQKLFDTESPMTSRFMVMAARATLTNVADTVPGFSQAYAQDPVGAIEQNEALLKDRLLGFQLTAQGGDFTAGFSGQDWAYNAEDTLGAVA